MYGRAIRTLYCQRCGAKLPGVSTFPMKYPPKVLIQYGELGVGVFLVIEAFWILVDPGLTAFRVFFYLSLTIISSLVLTLFGGVIAAMLISNTLQYKSRKEYLFVLFVIWIFLFCIVGVSMIVNIGAGASYVSNFLLAVGFDSELFILQLHQVALIIAAIIFPIGILLIYRRRTTLSEIKTKIYQTFRM